MPLDSSEQHIPYFLQGGGEMGNLLRSIDWANNPLGIPESWPAALKHTVSMMLGSSFPTLICWGGNFTQLYNDKFRPINGENKHPQALGGSARDTYAEIWDAIGPMFAGVMEGQSFGFPDFMVQLNRNGHTEDCYFDFSYSPIRVEDGSVGGVLVICMETTAKVNALKELEESNRQQQTLNEELREALAADLQNQRKLKETERNLRAVISQAPVAMAIFRRDDYVVDIVNDRALELWGRTYNEVKDRPILQVMPELESQGIKKLLDDVYINGNPFSATELPVGILRNGLLETAYVNFVYDPLYDAEGNINGVITIGFEVTESVMIRKQTEDSEAKLDQVIDLLPAAITVLIGPDLVIERTNPSNLAYWQKTKTQTFGKPLLAVLPELADQPFPGQLKQVLATGETIIVHEGEVNLENPDGSFSITYVDYSYQPLTDKDGERIGVLVMSNDVTEKVVARRQLEISEEELQSTNEELAATNEELSTAVDKLQESEQQVRSLVEGAPFPIAVYLGRGMRIASANQAIIDVWGKGDDVIGNTYFGLLPELATQDVYDKLTGVYDTGIPFHGRNQYIDLVVDGVMRPYYFNYSFTPLINSDGEVYGVMNTAADVTDLNLAKQKVEQSEQNFRNMILQAPVAMCLLTGPDYVVDLVNTAMMEIWGKPYADVINKPVFDALPDAREQGLEQVMDMVYQSGEPFFANEQPVALLRFGQQDIVYQNFVYQPYRDNDGKILGILAISVNVTEQVLARQKIEQSEAELQMIRKKLEAELEIGKQLQQQKDGFIGMASHELKTPLTSLSAIIQVAGLKLKHSQNTFLKDAMAKANTQVKRMNGLINGFLNISRLESGKIQIDKTDFELDKLLKEVISEHELTVSTHIIQLLVCDEVKLHADRDKIGSVISNLLSNAVKYSPKGKNITVQCRLLGSNVQVSVKDEGMGIKADDLPKVFDRYYRVQTSHTQHISGFGIGLYLSAEIIHRHGGDIWADSQSGVGSTFYFSLPLI